MIAPIDGTRKARVLKKQFVNSLELVGGDAWVAKVGHDWTARRTWSITLAAVPIANRSTSTSRSSLVKSLNFPLTDIRCCEVDSPRGLCAKVTCDRARRLNVVARVAFLTIEAPCHEVSPPVLLQQAALAHTSAGRLRHEMVGKL